MLRMKPAVGSTIHSVPSQLLSHVLKTLTHYTYIGKGMKRLCIIVTYFEV